MPSNQSRSRTLNLVYRMVNAIEGKCAHIERSRLYRMYDVNKYSVSISLAHDHTKKLKEIMEKELINKGFEAKYTDNSAYWYLVNNKGVTVKLNVEKDLIGKKCLGVFIYWHKRCLCMFAYVMVLQKKI